MPSPSGRSRTQPGRNPVFAHLDLAGLRAYRRGLMDEEGRASYWRRLVQTRRQLVEAAIETDGGATRSRLDALPPILTETRPGVGRLAYLSTQPPDGTPPLPDLERLWASDVAFTDPVALRRLAAELAAAEQTLNEYRTTVHSRLDETTAELVARYFEDPTSCFVALPFGEQPVPLSLAARG